MRISTLGLKSIIASITEKKLLRQLFLKHAETMSDDKVCLCADKDFFEFCKLLRAKRDGKFENLLCSLQEISDVCTDRGSSERLISILNTSRQLQTCQKVLSPRNRSVQNIAIWTLLNQPRLWEHITLQTKATSNEISVWDEFKLADRFLLPIKDTEALAAGISKYLVEETFHGEHVHIELDEEANCDRYLVSINNFPSNVQQFDPKGVYAVARDANALNFIIEYIRKDELIRLRCPLSSNRRRGIAEVFAQKILHTRLASKGKIRYDLSCLFSRSPAAPRPNSDISSVHRTGLSVSFRNRHGSLDTISLTSDGPSNLTERMRACLRICGVDESECSVAEVKYALVLKDNDENVIVTASIKPDGIHTACRKRRLRNLIEDYLKRLVA